ncbi:transcriptional regulator [Microlunatus endophyticus]|uniref:Transcriptional regulator n=1 Tax=Microlunatus endophyticus TaxID=1716077 RepID=A0A917S4P5_9ACTN|nr:metalloregulator ArsR/SmtB family transcription factor [Microlunatus endophyticus]GGL57929.1 transcriptional regulator [Microlunatus endophyticus]
MVQQSEMFAALADPTRLRVVELLGEGPQRAGELASRAGVSAPVMSRHLRQLLQAGLVSDTRDPDDARARIFTLRPELITSLQAWIDQVQAHWDEQLGSFKTHVEEKRRTR